MASLSDFDIDLAFGQEGESLVKDLLTGGQTIEVKRDKRWKETGNLYIETECYFNRTHSWGPSGINVTKAAYWAFVLEDMVLIIPTEALKYAVEEFGSSISCNIPPNPSKGVLVTVPQLLKSIKEYQNVDLG
jgi:hypothetical protein